MKHNMHLSKIYYCFLLSNFKWDCTAMIGEDHLLFSHTNMSMFLCPNFYNNAPSAKFAFAKNPLLPCPPTLVKVLYPSNLICHVWVDSYNQKRGTWTTQCLWAHQQNAIFGLQEKWPCQQSLSFNVHLGQQPWKKQSITSCKNKDCYMRQFWR